MRRSIEGELSRLRERLGPAPLSLVFQGLDHLRYIVSEGEGLNLIKEVSAKTGYRFAAAWRNRQTGEIFCKLCLNSSPLAIIIQESRQDLYGFPRLNALAFRVSDLLPVREFLNKEGIVFAEEPWGIMTGPLPGLGDRFIYLPANGQPWHDAPNFEPSEVNQEALASAPFNDVRANIGALDHIAYRVPLQQVEQAAAIIMKLTAYSFDSCYTVTDQNAETMVFRWGDHKPAIVASYGWDAESVVHTIQPNTGRASTTRPITRAELRAVLERQKEMGLNFTTDALIGDETRGILQIFSAPSPHSHEITEYVERFGNFTGFFDKGNVGELMNSTKRFI